MLYDKRWGETKVDPFNLDNLIAWLEKQPADMSYVYTNPCGCVLAQYFQQYGYRRVSTLGVYAADDSIKLPEGWDRIASGHGCYLKDIDKRLTFGRALGRARALRDSQ
jgi:hypothetical protein